MMKETLRGKPHAGSLTFAFAALFVSSALAAVTPFGAHERVGFLGDSITHGGSYVVQAQLFWLLRHPGAATRLDNIGSSGDCAAPAVARWSWDGPDYASDRVFVMFGMNDVRRDLWPTVMPTDATNAQRRVRALADYEKGLRTLVDKILAEKKKVVVITPSPYDSVAQVKASPLLGCNEPGLAGCAEICRRTAAEKGLEVVDFHAPLTALLKEHPELKLLGDRVHPGWNGSLAMSTLILAAMGETNEVGRLELDAKGADAASGWYAPRRLPLPVDADYRAMAPAWPLLREMNREPLVVKNLRAGHYEVRVGDTLIGTWTAEQLAAGVNMAELDTPSQKTARQGAGLARTLRERLDVYRTFRLDRQKAKSRGLDLANPADFETFVSNEYASAKGQPWENYIHWRMQKDRAFLPHVAERMAEIEKLYADMRALRPRGRTIRVSRVEIGIADDWTLWTGDTTLAVEPPEVIAVRGERHTVLPTVPTGGWKCGGWQRGSRLKALIACECSVKDALLAASVRVRALDGTLLVPGRDYALESAWAAIARIEGGRIGPSDAVLVDYDYRAQRLDRVVRTAKGGYALRRGVAAATQPELPALQHGDRPCATIWLDGTTTRLTSRNLYRVTEDAYPDASAWGMSVAQRLLPKTWAKLEKGEPLTILAWGDSVTACGFLLNKYKWQEQFVARLRECYPKSEIRLISNGWGGRNSASFMDEKSAPKGSPYNYVEKVLGSGADLVVMEFVNDASATTYPKLDARYSRIRDDLAARGMELCILTPHYTRADWMGLADPTATTDDPRPYVKTLRNWCARKGVACADASLRWGRLARRGIPYQTLLVNEINHPNAFGMSLFADAILDLFRGGEGPGPMRTGRRLVWSDEFEGDRLDPAKWRFRVTMGGSDCVYSNDARTARVENGCLHLQVHPSGQKDKKFMLSNGVTTHETMSFAHGYLEMRARVPFRHGAWPSFWMTRSPYHKSTEWGPETDIFEVFSNTNTVVANIHKWGLGEHVMLPGGEGYPARGYSFPNAASLNDEFHVYGFEWNPREMVFYVDDKPYYRCRVDEGGEFSFRVLNGMRGFHDPQSIIFNNEIFTPGHGWCPDGFELTLDDPLPIDYWIDWVRLWQDSSKEELYTP